MKLSVRVFILFCIFIMQPQLSFGDTAEYLYDDAGRLVRVVKGTEGIIYQYDEVGNLLSISRGTISSNPPILQSINPDMLFIGSTTLVTISGQNLFTTKEVISNNSTLSIRVLSITDTEIKAEITVSPDAIPGTVVNITVNTLYGTANIQTTLTSSKLTFGPGLIILNPEKSDSITASIYPHLDRAVNIQVKSSDPSVVSAPQSVTIPSGGTSTFTINALREGDVAVSSGSAKTTVFVTNESFTPVPGETTTNNAGPVSVFIEPAALSDTSTSTLPVSVYIETPLQADNTTLSFPVSVYIEAPASVNSTSFSLPASVYIETPTGDATAMTLPLSVRIAAESIPDASAVALPVSIRIEAPAGEVSSAALPVSVYIESATANTTTLFSLPVSIYIETQTGNSTVMSLPVSIKINPQ